MMGGAMGLMMLWMLHQQMTAPNAMQGLALVGFIGAHVIILAALIVGALFASRLHPRIQSLLAKLHRPSWSHLRDMLAGMALTAGFAHIILHGGL